MNEAIQAAKEYWGRTWKSKLWTAWVTGNYPDSLDSVALQKIRNEQGASWLYDYKGN
tara:strand:- start:43 stop:213 length:171 start_codon:yes stop_codon:yes gene_type:complete